MLASDGQTIPSFPNGTIYQNSGGSTFYLEGGLYYSFTYSITFDTAMTTGSAGTPPPHMVKGYCLLHSNTYGDVIPTMVNNGFMPSTFISNDTSFATTITMTDTIYITSNDSYSLGVFYYNSITINAGMYLNGTINKL